MSKRCIENKNCETKIRDVERKSFIVGGVSEAKPIRLSSGLFLLPKRTKLEQAEFECLCFKN